MTRASSATENDSDTSASLSKRRAVATKTRDNAPFPGCDVPRPYRDRAASRATVECKSRVSG
jgi:hypothetical protein